MKKDSEGSGLDHIFLDGLRKANEAQIRVVQEAQRIYLLYP
jgi:hypothetical protein